MKINDYVAALPDVYRREPESNNYKLLLLEQRSVQALYEDIDSVWEALDVRSAYGKTLDLYGEMYDLPRGKATDEQYRLLIMQQAAQNMVEGDYNSIVGSIAAALGVSPTQFVFAETNNPAEVECKNLPYSVLVSAGLTIEQTVAIIEKLLPAGVTLAPMNLAGTFEFGTANEYDANAGFGDVAQTTGGYFGYIGS